MRHDECKNVEKGKQLSESYAGTLGVFSKGVLIIIENNRHFVRIVKNQDEGKLLNDKIMKVIKENEAIAAIDASCNDDHMTGSWKIEDYLKTVKDDNRVWKDTWKHNTAQSAEVLAALDLVETISRNMKNEN